MSSGARSPGPLQVAILDTPSYEFMAAGRTEREALATLRRAWAVHAEQTGATFTWEDLAEEVTVVELWPGHALRDRSPFPTQQVPGADGARSTTS